MDDYLDSERNSGERHEYLDGVVYAMSEESIEHSTIGSNINAILNYQLRYKPCRVLQPNMKVYSRLVADQTSSGLFAYPDCMVVCGAC
ncbi:MAG: Uma2 family endonuclease [Blastocatellia bacterium]